MSDQKRDGLYVYQPYGTAANKNALRPEGLFAVAGLPPGTTITGLTREEADRILGVLRPGTPAEPPTVGPAFHPDQLAGGCPSTLPARCAVAVEHDAIATELAEWRDGRRGLIRTTTSDVAMASGMVPLMTRASGADGLLPSTPPSPGSAWQPGSFVKAKTLLGLTGIVTRVHDAENILVAIISKDGVYRFHPDELEPLPAPPTDPIGGEA